MTTLESLMEASGRMQRIVAAAKKVDEGIQELTVAIADMKKSDKALGNGLGILSGKEQAFLELIGSGAAMSTIAKRLKITVRTAETHQYNIRRKLGIKDVTELKKFAAQNAINNKTNRNR